MKNITFAVLTIFSALFITSFVQLIMAPLDVEETDTNAEATLLNNPNLTDICF